MSYVFPFRKLMMVLVALICVITVPSYSERPLLPTPLHKEKIEADPNSYKSSDLEAGLSYELKEEILNLSLIQDPGGILDSSARFTAEAAALLLLTRPASLLQMRSDALEAASKAELR